MIFFFLLAMSLRLTTTFTPPCPFSRIDFNMSSTFLGIMIFGVAPSLRATHIIGLGVQTRPMVLYGLGIVPLFSWYHESFDREMDIAGIRIPSLEMVCKDFHACKWPREISNRSASLASYFDAMNEENEDAVKLIKNTCTQIITFSHFLPRYIQAPLAYPRERKRRMNGGETWLPFCVYSGGKFADRLSPCYWSDYYAAHPRAPHVTELAPWVARFYNRA
uniref:Uncharacterized protein n=1 Tax=Populus trichocarpa TaxID=3694 RepID=A0A2K1X8D1_POPTR